MKKKILLIIIGLLINITIIISIWHDFNTMSKITKLHINIDFPEDYKNLFNSNTQTRIKHIFTEKYKKQETYPVSYIKIDTIGIYIFKYENVNFVLKNIKIEADQFPKGYMYSYYHSIGFPNTDIVYRDNLSRKMDTLYIRSTKSIDTLLFNGNKVFLKGEMGSMEIKLDKSKQNADQYFEDETYFRKSPKFYLIWLQKNGYVYELFIENKEFDDKKIMSLFEE